MAKLKQPVFLMCGERSGSNLIRAIMNSHSSFLSPMPLHLIRLIWTQVGKYGDLSKDKNWNMLIRHTSLILENQVGTIGDRYTEEALKNNVSQRSFENILNFIYSDTMQKQGKERLFLKELYVHQFLPLLLAHYPDAKFVYQVRDPRDVVLSMMKLPLMGGVLSVSHMLRAEQSGFINDYHALTSERVFVQRYEDLIERPQEVLKSLCAFLEVEFEEKMLDFYKTDDSKESAQKSVAWKNLAQPLMTKNKGKYRISLTSLEIGIIETFAERVFDAFEYERDVPTLSRTGRLICRLSSIGRIRKYLDKMFPKEQLELSDEERSQRAALEVTLRMIDRERETLSKRISILY